MITTLDKQFWWIEYDIHCELWTITPKRNQCVSDKHPFEWLKLCKRLSSFERTLVNWRKITEKEYLSGKEVLDIG